MTTQTPRPIVLLVAEEDKSDAEIINSRMRRMGLNVHTHFCSVDDDITDLIEKHNPDVIVLRHALPGLNVKDLDSFTSTWVTELPIILVHEENQTLDATQVTKDGAEDVVQDNDFERLKQVITRTGKLAHMSKRLTELEHLYKESEIRCNSLLDNSRDAIAYIHEGMHVYANESYLELFGFDNFSDLEGLPIMDMVVSEKKNELKDFLRDINVDKQAVTYTTDLVTAGDTIMQSDLEFSKASIDGEPCSQVIIRKQTVDEDAARELEAKLSAMSKIDSQTGLINRSIFMEEFQQRIGTLDAEKKEYAYFHISFNEFKEHARTVGPLESDKLLQAISSCLKSTLGEKAMICHYGSQHFSYLTQIKDRAGDIKKRADALLANIQSLNINVASHAISNLTFSIGVSLVDDASLQVKEVIERSGKALNEVDGKNEFSVYTPAEGEMSQNQIDKAWTEKLERALTEQRFNLLFQPLIKLTGNDIERYEILVRMKDPDGKDISPGEFLPAADRTGISKQIDRYVINHAFKHLVEKFKSGGKAVVIIKLTSSSLKDQNLFTWIKDRIKATGLPKNCVIFEVKLDSVIEATKQASAFAAGLGAIGCGFAIDDVKPSEQPQDMHTALGTVNHQFVKFDGSLSNDLYNSSEHQEFITEISGIAHDNNRLTILPYIEDPMTLSVAYSVSCDLVQGHFLSPPLESMNFDFEAAMG